MVTESRDGAMQEISWRALAAMVDRASQRLSRSLDASPMTPRRIGHASDNSLADVVIALASMSLGAIEFPFDHRLDSQEIRRRWATVGGLWIDQTLRSEFSDLTSARDREAFTGPLGPPTADPDAPSLVLWTSGTTDLPRGVTLSSRNLLGNAAAKLAAVPQRTDDHRLCVLPLSHAYARTCDFGTWLLSGCILSVGLGYGGLQRLAPQVQPTLVNVVPSIANRMLDDPRLGGLQRLRLLGCGGAALPSTDFDRWKQRGVTVIQGYGMTETSPVICSATPKDATAGSVGRFVDGWEWTIRDHELWVRGAHVMLGYWNDAEATSERITRDGWLTTGDQVDVDPVSGQVRVLGRMDDVIVLDSGRKIHPDTVERCVHPISGVRHAMLVHRHQLELWLDCDENHHRSEIESEVRERLRSMESLQRVQIRWFDPCLQVDLGEVTSKGTIRRSQILENRFVNQAGS